MAIAHENVKCRAYARCDGGTIAHPISLINFILPHLSGVFLKGEWFMNKKIKKEVIKTIDDNTLIAVRIARSKELKIRTLYPISEAKKEKLKEKSFLISV